MASIYKRGRTWWIQYRVGGKNVQRSLNTTNEQVARKKKKQFEGLEVTGQLDLPSKTPIVPFLESFCAFLQQHRSTHSYKADASYLRGFFGPICKALMPGPRLRQGDEVVEARSSAWSPHRVNVRFLEDITPLVVNHFITERVNRDGISPKTVNRTREILHVMFNYAIKYHGFVSEIRGHRNPVDAVQRYPEAAPDIHFLDLTEIAEQLEAVEAHPALHGAVATMIYAGIRREECLWLTRDDVELDRKAIRVRAKTVDGKSWQPKTKKNRAVPISTALLGILSAYRPGRGVPWFFPSPRGKHWDPDCFSRMLRRINKKSGLAWGCLDFRHTFGSHLAMKGESLYKISELMGNSPEICRRHYAALIPERMRDTVEFDQPSEMDPQDTRPVFTVVSSRRRKSRRG